MRPVIISAGAVIAAAATGVILALSSPSPSASAVSIVADECRTFEGAKSENCKLQWSGMLPDGGCITTK